MRTTIDRAGRLVIPKALRDRIGLSPGEVEVVADGASLRVSPVTSGGLATRNGRVVIPADGASSLDDEAVRALREADQR